MLGKALGLLYRFEETGLKTNPVDRRQYPPLSAVPREPPKAAKCAFRRSFDLKDKVSALHRVGTSQPHLKIRIAIAVRVAEDAREAGGGSVEAEFAGTGRPKT